MYFMLQILIHIEVNGPLIALPVHLLLQLSIFGDQNVKGMRLMLKISLLLSSLFDQLGHFVLLFIDELAGVDYFLFQARE